MPDMWEVLDKVEGRKEWEEAKQHVRKVLQGQMTGLRDYICRM